MIDGGLKGYSLGKMIFPWYVPPAYAVSDAPSRQ